MPQAVLTISSRNYSSWSLRGWLLCRLAGLDVTEETMPIDAPGQRAELLLLSPSVLVPRLTHEGASVWDTLAIAEYLHESFPEAGLYPIEFQREHALEMLGIPRRARCADHDPLCLAIDSVRHQHCGADAEPALPKHTD